MCPHLSFNKRSVKLLGNSHFSSSFIYSLEQEDLKCEKIWNPIDILSHQSRHKNTVLHLTKSKCQTTFKQMKEKTNLEWHLLTQRHTLSRRSSQNNRKICHINTVANSACNSFLITWVRCIWKLLDKLDFGLECCRVCCIYTEPNILFIQVQDKRHWNRKYLEGLSHRTVHLYDI